MNSLLLEIPSGAVKVFAVGDQENTLNLASPVVVVNAKSFSLINGESGYVYRTFDVLKGLDDNIEDCIYASVIRAFVVATSNSDLWIIFTSCKNLLECPKYRWGSKLVSLHCHDNNILVLDNEGKVCQFSLSSEGSFPAFVMGTGVKSTMLHAIVNKSANTLNALRVSSSKSKKQPSQANQYEIVQWKLQSLLPNKSNWLLNESAAVFNVNLNHGDEVINMIAHHSISSYSLLIKNTESGNRWLKFSSDNNVLLFERSLTNTPVKGVEIHGLLWILDDNNHLSSWDIRYGVQVKSYTLSAPPTSNKKNTLYWILPYTAGCHVITTVTSSNNESCILYRSIITTALSTDSPAARGGSSLSNVLGKLANNTTSTIDVSAATATTDKKKSKDIVSKDKEDSGKVLSALPGPMKRKLQQAKISYDNQIKYEMEASDPKHDYDIGSSSNSGDNNNNNDNFVSSNKIRRFYVDIPDVVTQAFMTRLENARVSDLLSSDWELVQVLIRSGTISLASNPSLLQQTILACRFDVLSNILRYVSDLSEKQCIKILNIIMLLPEEALKRISIHQGFVYWGKESANSNNDNNLNRVESDTKKKKASKKSEEVTGKSIQETKSVNKAQLLQALIESLLHRTSAFSTALLSEAIKLLSPQANILLLRLFSLKIRCICTSNNNSSNDVSTTTAGLFGDEEIKRAITWIEALLDGHFTSTIMQASVHKPTRQALSSIMESIVNVQEVSKDIEQVLGLWTHIQRIMQYGGEIVKPVPSLYQVETFPLFN